MQEVTDEIVKCMTSPEFINKLVIIFAGYADEIDSLLTNANPGLRSRFNKRIEFDPFTEEVVVKILLKKCASGKLELDNGAVTFVSELPGP